MKRNLILGMTLVLVLSMTFVSAGLFGITGNALWDWNNYCTASSPCGIGEGDCDGPRGSEFVADDGTKWRKSDQCKSGYCHLNVGANYGQASSMDVCEDYVSINDSGEDWEKDYIFKEGETTTVSLPTGKSLEVNAKYISDSSIILEINGRATSKLTEELSYQITERTYLTIESISCKDLMYAGICSTSLVFTVTSSDRLRMKVPEGGCAAQRSLSGLFDEYTTASCDKGSYVGGIFGVACEEGYFQKTGEIGWNPGKMTGWPDSISYLCVNPINGDKKAPIGISYNCCDE